MISTKLRSVHGRKLWLQLGASALALASAGSAMAQDTVSIEEIVVTAQRRAESVQDVPMTVTPVTGEQIDKLKLQRFEDVQQLSPGLALSRTGRDASSSLRGVTFNPDTGAAPSIDTYFNEIPIDPQFMYQSIFDVQQIEVLRGPQGLQRGRPAPTGALTLTTRRPDLNEFGATASFTHSEFDANNIQLAGSVPIIRGVLAVRLAALYDENDNGGVENVITGDESHRVTRGFRATAHWRPINEFNLVASYNRLRAKAVNYVAAEGPGVGYNGPAIPDGRDRLSVTEGPAIFPVKEDLVSVNASYEFAGHRLSYNFGWLDAEVRTISDQDSLNAVPNFVGLQSVRGPDETITHELRLESTGDNFVDYTVGLWYFDRNVTTRLTQGGNAFLPGAFGPSTFPPIGPANPLYVLGLGVTLPVDTTNKAIYGNLVFHLTPKTELTVGARYFEDDTKKSVVTQFTQTLIALPSPLPAGAPCSLLPASAGFTGGSNYPGTCDLVAIPASTTTQVDNRKEDQLIYGATLRHKFTDRVMAYASFGTSWRGGGMTVGVSGVPDDALFFGPEKSKSYEVGVKSEWYEGRLRLNAAIFRQDYDDYINTTGYRIPYVQVAGTQLNLQDGGGFTFNADAVTTGVEVELAAMPTDRLNISVNWATADGHYKNAAIPCRDSNNDGVDDNGVLPVGYLPANGQTYATCRSSGRINNQPDWSLNAQAEYTAPLGGDGMEGYVRGLLNYRDDVRFNNFTTKDYSTLNLFAGVRTEAWDAGVFVRNVFDETLQLSDPQLPLGAYGGYPTGYRSVTYLRGREFGVSLRYSFGGG